MKILMIAPANSIHTYRWIEFLVSQNCDICLISSNPINFELPLLQFHHININHFYIRLPYLLLKIHQIATSFAPDLLQVHYHTYLGWLPALLNLKPLVITLWGSDILKRNSLPAKILMKLSFSKSDLVTADANNMLEIAKKRGARKTELLLFGVDTHKFFELPEKKSLKKEFGFQEDDFIILSPRALQAHYQIEAIIQACHDLNLQKPNRVKLLILEYLPHKEYQSSVHALVQELNAGDWIKFISGMPHDQLSKVYNACDLMVSMPKTDGTPVSFLEAMACGLPILSNYHEAYDGLFEVGKDIEYFDSATGLTQLMQRMLDTPELCITLKTNGKKIASKFSQEAEMNRMHLYYHQLIANNF